MTLSLNFLIIEGIQKKIVEEKVENFRFIFHFSLKCSQFPRQNRAFKAEIILKKNLGKSTERNDIFLPEVVSYIILNISKKRARQQLLIRVYQKEEVILLAVG